MKFALSNGSIATVRPPGPNVNSTVYASFKAPSLIHLSVFLPLTIEEKDYFDN